MLATGPNFEFKPGQIGTLDSAGTDLAANEAALAPKDPALLAVGIKLGDEQLCTGVLVGPLHVLTAGHCACSEPSTYEVILGDDAHPPNIGRKLAQPPILFDPRSCPETGQIIFGKDLALLILEGAFRCNQATLLQTAAAVPGSTQNPRPITARVTDCDPTFEQPARGGNRVTFGYPSELLAELEPQLTLGRELLVVGYGFTDSVNLGSRAQTRVPIRSIACAERALENSCQPFTEMILADRSGAGPRSDSCRGDSGGPVFLLEGDSYTLVGITSRAGPGPQGGAVPHCGGGGIYTILGRQSVLSWLIANRVPAAQRILLATGASPR